MKNRIIEPEQWWAALAGSPKSGNRNPSLAEPEPEDDRRNRGIPGIRETESYGGREARSLRQKGVDPPGWWTRLPPGERAVIRAVVRMLRSARRSRVPMVEQAARKWERGLGCFIKVRLIWEKQRAESVKRDA